MPEVPSEQELIRLYGWNKARLNNALRELASSGIVERKAGYGWQFQPLVTGLATQHFSYDFRRTIECAAISSPGYRIDEPLLRELRNEQIWLLDGGLDKVTHIEMFEIGSRFHESKQMPLRRHHTIEQQPHHLHRLD
ncbi:GntR family transcriptional regulator [Pseudomonas fulva]|nr:GntR family transcriptional regulator [Pseudomonas fulva]